MTFKGTNFSYSEAERKEYIQKATELTGRPVEEIESIIVTLNENNEDVDMNVTVKNEMKFERIRRITGLN